MVVCWLIFGPSAVFFSAGARALADYQDHLATVADPKVYIEPPMLDVADPTNQRDGSNDAAVWTPEFGSSAGATPALHNSRQPVSIPCLHGVFSEDPIEGNSETSECAERPDEQQSFAIQFGRHIGTPNGILGDADGIRVDYRLTGELILNGIAGYPVLSAEDQFNTSRRVFGISADLVEFAPSWDLNSYIIEQHDNQGVASRAVGGAIRYLQTKRSLLLYTDYDVAEKSVNAFLASGAWMLTYNTRVSAMLDIRTRPIQKRQQNYLQQSMVSAKGWKWMLPSGRIKQLTKDGARGVSTLALGLSHAFSQRLTVSGDVAVIDASNDEESDGTALRESFEYFSHLKLSAKNLVLAGASNVLDLRHRVTDSSRISSACLNTRYDINRYWTINPRFSTDYGSNAHHDSVSTVNSSAVKMEYRWKRKYALHFELGGKWSNEETSYADKSHSTYFLALGYQTEF